MTRVEVLVFEGCPHVDSTMQLVREVIAADAPDAQLVQVTVDASSAESHRFLGSPSVRVDGVDIDPDAAGRDQFRLGCRVYRTANGMSGTPPLELVREALRRARA